MVGRQLPLVTVLLSGLGCASVRPLSEPAEYISTATPDVVYVTYRNRTVLPIVAPRMSGDTIVGMWQGVARQVSVPLSEVERVSAFQPDKTRTTLLIAGLGTATVVGVYMLLQGGEGAGCDSSLPPDRGGCAEE